jgi:hypothetical protein
VHAHITKGYSHGGRYGIVTEVGYSLQGEIPWSARSPGLFPSDYLVFDGQHVRKCCSKHYKQKRNEVQAEIKCNLVLIYFITIN